LTALLNNTKHSQERTQSADNVQLVSGR